MPGIQFGTGFKNFKVEAKWLTPKKLNITEAFFFNIWDIFLHF